VPKVKGTKMTITCFWPVFIGLKMGFPILLNYLFLCGTKTSFPFLVIEKGFQVSFPVEIRPKGRGDEDLCIGYLPQKKVTYPMFPTCSYE